VVFWLAFKGHERFSSELSEHYFTHLVKWTGISWSQFWELGLRERLHSGTGGHPSAEHGSAGMRALPCGT
jgi:hypothetical protein